MTRFEGWPIALALIIAIAPALASAQGKDVDAWYAQSVAHFQAGDHDTAATSLAHIAREWPQVLVNIPTEYLSAVAYQATADGQSRLDLLQALFDAGWDDRGLGADHLWVDLAGLHVDRGETALADAVVARITDAHAIVRLRMDKRFDALVDRGDPHFDVMAAMQSEVAQLRKLVADHPRWLEARNTLGYALLEAGEPEAALQDADAIVAAMTGAQADALPFDDPGDYAWTANNRAAALRRLGRIEEAVAVMLSASRLDERGELNVSQALNLGHFQCRLGRPHEVWKALSQLGDMSGYGRMVQSYVLHCAALALGDDHAAKQALDYLLAHKDDGPGPVLDALLDAARDDAAAALLVEMLQSPADRSETLFWLQDFRQPDPLPGEAALRKALDRVLERPEVRAAIDAVGRIERHGIYADSGVG